MTEKELQEQIRKIIPYADFDYDNDGQLIVYTNLSENSDTLQMEPHEV